MTPRERDVVFIAGACGAESFPENTAEAFRRCLSLPVDGVEVDLHLSADGVVVAHHDYRLVPDRTRIDGDWILPPAPRIRDLPFSKLQRCDVGRIREGSAAHAAHANRAQWDNAFIPSLQDLLALVRAQTATAPLLYAELKTNPQEPDESAAPEPLVEAVLADIQAAGWLSRTRLIAFDWRVLRLARAREPEVATAHLVIPRALEGRILRDGEGCSLWADGCDPERHGGSILRAIVAHGGDMASFHFRDVTPALVAEARALGLEVAVWGLVQGDDVRAMLELGVASVTLEGPDWGPF